MKVDGAIELFGTAQLPHAETALSAGSLTCRFCNGALKDIRWNDVEVVRAISYLFRDKDWATSPSTVERLNLHQGANGFRVDFHLQIRTPQGSLPVAVEIEGEASGRLTFEATATPDVSLMTNRCGFVLLHPASVAGQRLLVEHTDGVWEETTFPLRISPSQPVFDIRALTYAASEQVAVTCRLEADLPHDPCGKFEMEDQRNWSDASYKTYVASLLDVWPYELPAGRPSIQRVALSSSGAEKPSAANAESPVQIDRPGDLRMPEIGIGIPPGVCRATAREIETLRAAGATWWIAEVDLRDPGAAEDLAAIAHIRAGLPIRVQVDAIVPDGLAPQNAATDLATACRKAGLRSEAIRILPASYLKSFQPTDIWPDVAPDDFAVAARSAFPGASIGGGMFTYFTELNRKRQSPHGIDFIGHATCPIVHAADDDSVMQTLEALPHIIASVYDIWPSLPYRLGPSTISMRRNPYGDAPVSNPQYERLAMAVADPREGARFGAAWTAAYAAVASLGGVDVLALGASHGLSGPFAHARDGIIPPQPSPSWDFISTLAKASGAPIAKLTSLPQGVFGLAWSRDGKSIEGYVVNITAWPKQIRWANCTTTHTNLAPYAVSPVPPTVMSSGI
jgi:hypothetical protein